MVGRNAQEVSVYVTIFKILVSILAVLKLHIII
jgi:hypothetical protein